MNYNIQQVNTSTVKNASLLSPPVDFSIPGDTSPIPKYVIAVTGKNILKFGYCCEMKGHIYPIFLKINGSYTQPIYVGKDGVYEMQPETFKEEDEQGEIIETTSDIIITEIMVPQGIDFTLDYVVSTI